MRPSIRNPAVAFESLPWRKTTRLSFPYEIPERASPELLPYVFDLFTQGSRTLDRSQGGLGIGLTLVRRIVEMHGGTVSATSQGIGRR